jgi:hypothetical protein
LNLAPFLTVTGTGDQTVDLSWTKPQFSAPSTGITGYELRYRETGAATWTTVPVSGPDNLTANVAGLTNGTEYEFEVRATYSPSGEGPWSNNVRATPYGPIGAPVVTATPGNAQVGLTWTKPTDGGHEIDVYSILWRPVGTSNWIGASAVYGTGGNPPATQTTITGLTNGTEYEFAVTANAVDGVFGPQGTATATPNVGLAVTLGWFLAEADGDLVDFRWQTVTETGVAGFNLLGVTEAGKEQLNNELIPSPVIDSLTPTDYAVSFAADATTFYLQEVGVDGGVTEHGPFVLGEAYGSYAQPDDATVTPKIWLPIQAQ